MNSIVHREGQSGPATLDVIVAANAEDAYATTFPDLNQYIERSTSTTESLKLCIATEDIVGPIRNGGIGSTYTYLSKMMAEEGHDVTILYLRGDYCENKTIEYWVDYYAEFGVKFVPLFAIDYPVRASAPRWTEPMYAMYEYLKSADFDLVHASEWHGSAYFCLQAKKLGLAFHSTTFCIKTSSPWLWNRRYGFHTIRDMADLPKIFAERRSVELADLVVGGSRHLLCWMLEHGYQLPAGRTHVQQNVMVPLDIDELAKPRRAMYGARMDVNELVFFGRLEYRKGLDVFCDAIDILLDEGMELPPIYLMGKYGESIPSYPEYSTHEYVKLRSRRWPNGVTILNNFNTMQALTFLLGGARLAVMPSIIENSTMAVYEAAYYGVPFIASTSGGTPELVADEHEPEVLVDVHPVKLADKLREAVTTGGFIAAPSFDNAKNLDTWKRFHKSVPSGGDGQPLEVGQDIRISLCLAVTDNQGGIAELLAKTDSLDDASDVEIIVVDNGSMREETKAWLDELESTKRPNLSVHRLRRWGEQHAQNHAASVSSGDILVFPQAGCFFKPGYFQALKMAAASHPAGVFCTFHDLVALADVRKVGMPGLSTIRVATMLEDHTTTFFDEMISCPAVAIRRVDFDHIGGFRDYLKMPGADRELLAQAVTKGVEVVTLPEALVWFVSDYPENSRVNKKALRYRSILPYLEASPRGLMQILMAARGFAAAGSQNSIVFAGSDAMPAKDMTLLYGSLSRYPRMRAFATSVYLLQGRAFGKLVQLQVNLMRFVMLTASRVRQLVKFVKGTR